MEQKLFETLLSSAEEMVEMENELLNRADTHDNVGLSLSKDMTSEYRRWLFLSNLNQVRYEQQLIDYQVYKGWIDNNP